MIDIHAHILPAIDDGPETIEESIELCKVAANDGIKMIVATPHTKDEVYEAKSVEILKAVDTLNTQLEENQIVFKGAYSLISKMKLSGEEGHGHGH